MLLMRHVSLELVKSVMFDNSEALINARETLTFETTHLF